MLNQQKHHERSGMASIEDLLLMKAAEDAAAIPTSTEAALYGGAGGAALGAMMGHDTHKLGAALNQMVGREPNRLKPGPRMAGGLVGLILGGGLGLGIRNEAVKSSPAAALLAKAQVQGGLNSTETRQLEAILREVYSEMGLRT